MYCLDNVQCPIIYAVWVSWFKRYNKEHSKLPTYTHCTMQMVCTNLEHGDLVVYLVPLCCFHLQIIKMHQYRSMRVLLKTAVVYHICTNVPFTFRASAAGNGIPKPWPRLAPISTAECWIARARCPNQSVDVLWSFTTFNGITYTVMLQTWAIN